MDIILNWDLQTEFLNLPLIVSNIVFIRLQNQKRVGGKAKSPCLYKWECIS